MRTAEIFLSRIASDEAALSVVTAALNKARSAQALASKAIAKLNADIAALNAAVQKLRGRGSHQFFLPVLI